LSKTKPFENPLIPNKKLQEIYAAMAEMRLLDEHVAGLQRGLKARRQLASTWGQEAVRVSTAIGLEPGDLLSDAHPGVAMDLLFGAKVSSLLRRVAEMTAGTKKHATAGGNGRQLPWVEDVEDRLRMAMGAAMALKTLKKTSIVVAYAGHGEVANGVWRRVLRLAAKYELPMIFVVLAGAEGDKKRRGGAGLAAKARLYGVPGIPVEAGDAVALYRVAQESIERTRGSGGPVLVECVGYRVKGAETLDSLDRLDPLLQMRSFLLGRRVCTEQWLDRAGDGLRRRLAAKKS
jgi:TPP-dependent pyruvate/acetoin dehydrogenase alpha subunit